MEAEVEARFNRLEDMLGQLMNMFSEMRLELTDMKEQQRILRDDQVAMREDLTSLRQEQTLMREDLTSLQQEQTLMRENLTNLRQEQAVIQKNQSTMQKDLNQLNKTQQQMQQENATRHQEIMKKFAIIDADRDLIWEKSIRNEREIAQLKPHIYPQNG